MDNPEVNIAALVAQNTRVMHIYWDSIHFQNVRYASANVESIIGYRQDLLASGAITYDSLIHPDDIQSYADALSAGIESELVEIVLPDHRLRHANGKYCWIQQSLLFDNPTDKLHCGVLSIAIDVSNLYQVKSALDDTTRKLNLAMTTSGVGLWELDVKSQVVQCDESWSQLVGLSGVSPRINLSRLKSMVHADDLHEFSTGLEKFLQSSDTYFEQIIRMRHIDGTWRYMLTKGIITERDEEGLALTFLCSNTDITKQKETELAALSALGARNHFFARVSHEIRTPMHGILGILNLLKGKIAEPENLAQIEKVISNSEQLLYLLNDILDLAKLNETQLSVSHEHTSVSEVMQQVSRLFSGKADAKSLAFNCIYPPPEAEFLLIDKVRLTQVLSNLVSNAIKYTYSGEVTLGAKFENGIVTLYVKDTGIGIKDTAAIFDAYKQEEGGVAESTGSTGLGLEIVKKLCDLTGIGLDISSSHEGTTIELLMGEPSSPKHLRKTNLADTKIKSKHIEGKRILVVDDSDINCEIACEMLRAEGAIAESTADGYDAVRLLSQDPHFDAILMDKHMPNMNGIEATRQICEMFPVDTRPIIIALTADAFETDNEEWFELGLDDLITKPFDANLLCMTIDRALKKRVVA